MDHSIVQLKVNVEAWKAYRTFYTLADHFALKTSECRTVRI